VMVRKATERDDTSLVQTFTSHSHARNVDPVKGNT